MTSFELDLIDRFPALAGQEEYEDLTHAPEGVERTNSCEMVRRLMAAMETARSLGTVPEY